MQAAIQMSNENLLSRFGIRNAKGYRYLTSEMVQWLLLDPNEDDLLSMILILSLANTNVGAL